MTYEEWKKEFEATFKKMVSYTLDQVGSCHFAEKLGQLSDDYPEYEERYVNEDNAYNIF